jgi:thiamine kinase-like enzyme
MPKYFGENNPEIPENLFLEILSYLDNRDLILVLPHVSQDWLFIRHTEVLQQEMPGVILKRVPGLSFNPLEDTLEKITSGYTNTNLKIIKKSGTYVLRIPLMKDHLFIHRSHEQANTLMAHALGLGAELVFYELSTGIMLTKWIASAACLTKKAMAQESILRVIAKILKQLHQSDKIFSGDWDIFEKIQRLYDFFLGNDLLCNRALLDGLIHQTHQVKALIGTISIVLCPCHNDLSPSNFLGLDDNLRIIDWEFSGNNDPLWDLVFLGVSSDLSEEKEAFLLSNYLGMDYRGSQEYSRYHLYKPMVHFWIGLLAILQIYNCNERLARDWLVRVSEQRFKQAKDLFDRSQGFIADFNLGIQKKDLEETGSSTTLFFSYSPIVPIQEQLVEGACSSQLSEVKTLKIAHD